MTFSLVGADNPFVSGNNITALAITPFNSIPDDRLELSLGGTLNQGPWSGSYSVIFGEQYIYNADGSVEGNTGGGGGSSRPTSGLTYPRLVG
jgi:hypothetical protein